MTFLFHRYPRKAFTSHSPHITSLLLNREGRYLRPDHHPGHWPLSTMHLWELLKWLTKISEVCMEHLKRTQLAVFSSRKQTFSVTFSFDIFSFWPNLPFFGRVHCYMCVDRVSILSLAPYWRTPGGEGRGGWNNQYFWNVFKCLLIFGWSFKWLKVSRRGDF